jgi:hypothetical protein
MPRHLLAFAICCVVLARTSTHPSSAPASTETADDTLWTAIIPEAFPHHIYTWHVRSDGTYREDGRDALSGNAVQPTLSGRWSMEGVRMVLRQDGLAYVFDGVVLGDTYAGTLYFGGRAISRFCAARGERAPDCNAAAKVAMSSIGLPSRAKPIALAGGGRWVSLRPTHPTDGRRHRMAVNRGSMANV